MRLEFKLPDLAEGMMEGEIVDWLVAVGDAVSEEQPVVEVMTDKATVVIPCPHDGNVLELRAEVGDIFEVGKTLFVLEVDDDAIVHQVEATPADHDTRAAAAGSPGSPGSQSAPADAVAEGTEGSGGLESSASNLSGGVAPVSAASMVAPGALPRVPRGAGKALATPATRRLARELGVDIGQVTGSGPAGRVTAVDVRGFADGRKARSAQDGVAGFKSRATVHEVLKAPGAAVAAASAAAATVAAGPVYHYAPAASAAAGEEHEERVKLRGLRRLIHGAMAKSTQTAAHFTYVDEVDCTRLIAARARLKPAAAARGVKMTYLPFIAKATLLALTRFPKMNAVMDDEAGEIVLKKYYHLGIAAATAPGLVVPVIRHADRLNLVDLAGHIQQLGDRARANALKPAELSGSTFTITSLGRLGGLFATPITNFPELGILGVYNMQKRAVVVTDAAGADAVVIRQMMNISATFDHRVIDGHEGAAFAQMVKQYLEDPALMMLEMS